MKKSISRVLLAVLIAAMMFSLAGCGNEAKETGYTSTSYEESMDSYYGGVYQANYAYDGLAMGAQAKAEMNGGYAAAPSYSGESSGGEPAQENTEEDIKPEKIIYSADATVETTEFDETIRKLEEKIEAIGGWVESSGINGANYSSISRGSKVNRTANYTIRVPNEKFDEMVNALSDLGNVPRSQIYTENVTSRYYDTQARLTAYEAQEQRLLELLDMAETVSDVIEIEEHLTEVRAEIESFQSSLRGWDRRVSWSTLNLTVNEVFEYTPAKTRNYIQKVWDSLKEGVESLGDFFLGFLEALPILLFVGLLIFLVVRIIRAILLAMRKRRAKRISENAVKQTTSVQEKKE